MHARVAAAPTLGATDNRDAPTVTRLGPPAEVDVVIDAEYGFLHRMTGLIDGQPLVVEELVDVVVDPPLDESVYRIDPSKFEVIDDKFQQVLQRAFVLRPSMMRCVARSTWLLLSRRWTDRSASLSGPAMVHSCHGHRAYLKPAAVGAAISVCRPKKPPLILQPVEARTPRQDIYCWH
jgi:hypothetical protein